MSEPIRILELRSVRGTGGGPEKTILLGAKRADKSRFAVTVCYVRDLRDTDFALDQRASQLGVDYVEVKERHSLDPRIWPALRRLVRGRRIDIVHSHEYKTNLLALLLARREAVIAMSTVHGWFGLDTIRERFYWAGDKRLLRRFPRLVAVSGALGDELVAAGCKPDHISVVPNGIDHVAFARVPGRRAQMRQSLGLADDEMVVGGVGRLEYQKRFEQLMEAVAAIRGRFPRVKLLIAGDGTLRDELAAARDRLQLGDRCALLGHRTDVPDLHHAFDVFVQASDREGSPNVLLEAMALETPIVATDVGGTRELIIDAVHGLIVPPMRTDLLASGIERVFADPDGTHARACAARRRIETDLSFDRRMDRVESIYEELASRRSPQRRPVYASQ
jgi:glycosyltransferase involved in cell wall biosynthesis